MKRKTNKIFSILMALLVLMLSFSAPAKADTKPTLTIDSVSLVKPGESATVALHLSNLPGGIYVLQLAVEYDADKLQLTSASAGDIFSSVGSATINSDNAGVIYLVWDSIDKQITDDCTLLTMTFSAKSTETCDTLVSISKTEECILASWEAMYTPVLTNGTVHIEKEWAVMRAAAANFAGKIGMNFYLLLPDYVLNDPQSYVLFTTERGITKQLVSNSILQTATVNGSIENRYCFSYYLVAYELRDNINLKLYNGLDELVPLKNLKGTNDYTNRGVDFSLYAYATNMLNSKDTSMAALANAVIDYGTAAQICFEHNITSDLQVSSAVTNVSLSQLDQFKAIFEGNLPEGITGRSISALFDSDNSFRLYYNYSNSENRTNYVYTIDNNQTSLHEIGNKYYIGVDNVPSNKLDVVHSYSVSDDKDTYIVKCSVLTYARASVANGNVAEKNLGKALYLYNIAANNKFGD